MGGDRQILHRVVKTFLEIVPEMLEKVRQACEDGDALTIRDAAHALKGSASNLGAHQVVKTAHELEQIGKFGNLQEMPEMLQQLDLEMGRLVEALEEFQREESL